MKLFLKTLGYGALYIVLSPAIAAILVFYFVYCIGIFLFQAVRNTIVFFSGGTVGGDLAPDVEAKKILFQKQRDKLEEKPAQPQQPPQQNIYVFNGNVPQGAFPGQNSSMQKPQLGQQAAPQIEQQAPNQIPVHEEPVQEESVVEEVAEEEAKPNKDVSFDEALMASLGIKAKRPSIEEEPKPEKKSHSMPAFNEEDFDDITISSEEDDDE